MSLLLLLKLLIISLLCTLTTSEPTQQQKQSLQSFYTELPHSTRLNWNPNDSVCNWVGVQCDPTRSFIYALHLPGVGLMGPIPSNTLGQLSSLRVLSLRANLLAGDIPDDFGNLVMLRSIYLQDNQLQGEFPSVLTRLTRLTRVDLSGNNFSGSVPVELRRLRHLTGLFLERNGFVGELPSLGIPSLVDFNVSRNRLNGTIPKEFSKFPSSSFAGNLGLCGSPLPPCVPNFPSPGPAPGGGEGGGVVSSSPAVVKSRKRLSAWAIVGIVVGCVLGLLVLVGLVLICVGKRRRRAKPVGGVGEVQPQRGVEAVAGSSSKDGTTGGEGGERNRLVFLDSGGVYSFDLEDLLRASAEVLGKGSVGTSYKAVLEEGTTVVVKRLKDVVVSKSDFEAHMEGVLGKIKHENVVPLRAYYFSKDEKLLVFDYLSAGSLSALLHGNRGSGRTPLDWDNRMRIAVGTARGLNHIHSSGNVPHGNIKSSNVLLRSENEPCLSDYGLNPLFSNNTPSNRTAGYRAPEVMETRKVTYKSDVYGFGVLLLELLTGKAPNSQASMGDEGIDLPRWVQSVVREEWTAEVFDVELMKYHNIEEEMVQLLQIAMSCVSTVPDQRPDMREVVRMIEEVSRGETDSGTIRQSSDDPSKGSDAHTPPIERTPPSSVTP